MLDSPDADKDEGHVSENQKPDALVSLVAEINSAHDAVCAALSAGLVHARRAGELLLRAKATLEHGDWLPWLTEHWPGDSRADRARLYARRPGVVGVGSKSATRCGFAAATGARAVGRQLRLNEPGRAADSTTMNWRPSSRVGGSTDDEGEARRHRTELGVMNRLLALPDLTLEDVAGIVHRAQEIEDEWFARRIRALGKLGVILNWADANGWGEVFRSLSTPEDYAALQELLDQRIAELTLSRGR